MSVVEMVLVGQVNKQIVNLINTHGGNAVGLSGKDGKLIEAGKLEMVISREDAPPEILDLGHVGKVTGVNAGLIRSLESEGFIPIIAPVGVNEAGVTYNINADTVAGALAAELSAKRLILLTDVTGVLSGTGELISSLTMEETAKAVQDGTIAGGMIPKLESCLHALQNGVEKAHIIDGRIENSLILELFTQKGIGTEIVAG
jgi:acetylglutamate kinase